MKATMEGLVLPKFEIGDIVSTLSDDSEIGVIQGLSCSRMGEWRYSLEDERRTLGWYEEDDMHLTPDDKIPSWVVPQTPVPLDGYLWTSTPMMRGLGLPRLPVSEDQWRSLIKVLSEWVIGTFGPKESAHKMTMLGTVSMSGDLQVEKHPSAE